jgi:hypothetical protein
MLQQESSERFDSSTAAWLLNRYRQAEYFSDLGLLRRVELGEGLFELMNHVGETRLKLILAQRCPQISWEAVANAMNLALAVNRDFLERSFRGLKE